MWPALVRRLIWSRGLQNALRYSHSLIHPHTHTLMMVSYVEDVRPTLCPVVADPDGCCCIRFAGHWISTEVLQRVHPLCKTIYNLASISVLAPHVWLKQNRFLYLESYTNILWPQSFLTREDWFGRVRPSITTHGKEERGCVDLLLFSKWIA